MKIENKTQTILLLIALIAIGGLVLYGKDKKTPAIKKTTIENTMPLTPPTMKGPTTPPPDYEPLR